MNEVTMAATIRTDGFYQTGPSEWEEWHAGVRMHGIHFHYLRLYANGDWIRCYRDKAFGFWEFTETITPELYALAKQGKAPKIGDYDPLCSAGTYAVTDNIVTLQQVLAIMPGRIVESRLRIEADRLAPNAAGAAFVWSFSPRGAVATADIGSDR